MLQGQQQELQLVHSPLPAFHGGNCSVLIKQHGIAAVNKQNQSFLFMPFPFSFPFSLAPGKEIED